MYQFGHRHEGQNYPARAIEAQGKASPQYGVAGLTLPVLGLAPELNPNRLCSFSAGRKTVNDK